MVGLLVIKHRGPKERERRRERKQKKAAKAENTKTAPWREPADAKFFPSQLLIAFLGLKIVLREWMLMKATISSFILQKKWIKKSKNFMIYSPERELSFSKRNFNEISWEHKYHTVPATNSKHMSLESGPVDRGRANHYTKFEYHWSWYLRTGPGKHIYVSWYQNCTVRTSQH